MLDLTIGQATFQLNPANGEWEALVMTNPYTKTQRLFTLVDARREKMSASRAIDSANMLRPETLDYYVNLETDMIRLQAALERLRFLSATEGQALIDSL